MEVLTKGPIQTSAVFVCNSNSNGSELPATRPPSPPLAAPVHNAVPINHPSDEQSSSEDSNQDSIPSHSDTLGHGSSEGNPNRDRPLRGGIHVMKTEAQALANLAHLYETDEVARGGFKKAIRAMMRQSEATRKLVVLGVGKSGHIGKKLVATFLSLDVRAVFLHPTEALHGDLGTIGPEDTLLFISYSGSTRELLAVLPHLDESLPVILISSHTRSDTCDFIRERRNTILLPAPVHEAESVSFGVSAPTTSTTVALALGDALALTVARELHPEVAQNFARNHPGGAIGLSAAEAVAAAAEAAAAEATEAAAAAVRKAAEAVEKAAKAAKAAVANAAAAKAAKASRASSNRRFYPLTKPLGQICIGLETIYDASHLGGTSRAASLLRASYVCKNGWVRIGKKIAAPSQLRSLEEDDLFKTLDELRLGNDGLLVSYCKMQTMPAETTVGEARDQLRGTQESVGGGIYDGSGDEKSSRIGTGSSESAMIAVTRNGRVCGVVEVARVFADDE